MAVAEGTAEVNVVVEALPSIPRSHRDNRFGGIGRVRPSFSLESLLELSESWDPLLRKGIVEEEGEGVLLVRTAATGTGPSLRLLFPEVFSESVLSDSE